MRDKTIYILARNNNKEIPDKIGSKVKYNKRGEEDYAENGWRHQGVRWRINSHTQQTGAGLRHVENGGADGIGQWTPTGAELTEQWMDGWNYNKAIQCERWNTR